MRSRDPHEKDETFMLGTGKNKTGESDIQPG
jgi:hypothetical protein